VSRRILRYHLGTARLRFLTPIRDLVGRTRRYPGSARVVPRPPRPRTRPALALTHTLVASDLNPRYLDFWPLLRRAWPGVVGLEPILVLIAEPEQVPEQLRLDPSIHVFAPVPGVHSAFQAQCIRLLYPALLEGDGGVVTSDADMVPLNSRYFHRPVSRIDAAHFVAYRDVLLKDGQIPVCYNAAAPATWRALFRVDSPEGIRARLAEWATATEYAGAHGGSGWSADQQILYRTALKHGRRTRSVWILDDHFTGFRRLERGALSRRRQIGERDRELIVRGHYSDFHCMVPHSELVEVNDLAVELAIEGARQRLDGPRLAEAASAVRLDARQ
jgi:hypothetical protein